MIPPALSMIEDLSALPGSIDADLLNPIVTRVFQTPARVKTWAVTMLNHYAHAVKPNAACVARVSGTATTATGEQRSWSVILKVLKSPVGAVMPNGMIISQSMADNRQALCYWNAKPRCVSLGCSTAYREGWPRQPVMARSDAGTEIWLWQAEAVNTVPWSWAHYREAAYRLGLWHGQYATGERVLPQFDWLSRNWLAQWVGLPLAKIVEMLDQSGAWSLPIIVRRFSGQEIAALRRLWARRGFQLACLAQQRQVLCHLDAYRSNFFWQGDTLTLIDWEFAGVGALGEEMAAFVGATLLLDHVPMAEAPQLEAVALDGYLVGLREAGWDGDADAVWQAYRCAMPLRYALSSLASIGRTAMQPDFAEHWSQQMGKPLESILAQRAEFLRFLLTRSC